MSNFTVPVVRIGKIGRHPNADNLSLTQVLGETVVFRTGDFEEGQHAIYVPEDAVVPETVVGTEFLGKNRRIRAKKLRGIFSCGLLLGIQIPILTALKSGKSFALADLQEGTDLSEQLGIVKWEEPMPAVFMGENERDPGFAPVYEVESHARYSEVYQPGEEVVVTEKIHGTNFRAVFYSGCLWVGSHKTFKRRQPPDSQHPQTIYWRAALQYGLDERSVVEDLNGIAIYGEVFGQVQDMKYGSGKNEIWLRLFDAYDIDEKKWLDWAALESFARYLNIPTVPVLYKGPIEGLDAKGLAEGSSLLTDQHPREGIVIKPTVSRWDSRIGRVTTKQVSEWYRTRKNPQEGH